MNSTTRLSGSDDEFVEWTLCPNCRGHGQAEGDGSGWDGTSMHTPACKTCDGRGEIPAPSGIAGLVRGSEHVHIEGLESELARLRHGLALIVRESEQFPDVDGIGAGKMARNLLAGAGR